MILKGDTIMVYISEDQVKEILTMKDCLQAVEAVLKLLLRQAQR